MSNQIEGYRSQMLRLQSTIKMHKAENQRLAADNLELRTEVQRLRELALNLSAAWHYGDWKAGTLNEREMQSLMEQAGYWPTTEDQIIERRYALTPPAADTEGK